MRARRRLSIPVSTSSGQFGHSQIALTANTYAHVLDALRADTATRADAALEAVMKMTPA
mgnify:CR=1 FL=1